MVVPRTCVTVLRPSQTHCLCQVVVCLEIVVCVSVLSNGAAIAGKAQNSGADGAPLCFRQGDGAEIQGQDVGASHRVCLSTEPSMASSRRQWAVLWTVWKVAHEQVSGGRWCPRIRSQAKEVWGRTVDDNHRHRPCKLIKYK